MKISYLITCHNETDTLKTLLCKVYDSIQYNDTNNQDEIVILVDSPHAHGDDVNTQTSEIIYEFTGHANVIWTTHPLNNNYGAHKNYGIEQCSGDWIFAIDGDELPADYLLGENLHALLESNPEIEAYAIPRINAWHGLTEAHAKQWGWSLDMSPTYNRFRAAWPDYQWRLFKRDYPRIQFKNRLHEKIDGYKKYAGLPALEEFALYHDKTIETQIKTNLRYNKDFTEAENRGISDKRA